MAGTTSLTKFGNSYRPPHCCPARPQLIKEIAALKQLFVETDGTWIPFPFCVKPIEPAVQYDILSPLFPQWLEPCFRDR